MAEPPIRIGHRDVRRALVVFALNSIRGEYGPMSGDPMFAVVLQQQNIIEVERR
jgi:hypothetical protein